MLLEALLMLVLGAATGFLAGTLGAGGGFATVTALLAAGLANQEAVGTSLLFTIVVGAWGAALHFRQGTGRLWVALALGIPSAVSAFLVAEVHLGHTAFNLVFAAIAGTTALSFVIDDARTRRRASFPPPISGAQDPEPRLRAVPTGPAERPVFVLPPPEIRPGASLVAGAVAGGAAIGVLKGLFGVGGGFVLVPFMVLVLRIPERIAVGSSLLAILLGSAAGGARHAMLGNVDWGVLGLLLPGGIVASFFGTRLVNRLSAVAIRRAFVALLLVATGFLAARAFW